jgi:GDPmannose 4,6-dehydratase
LKALITGVHGQDGYYLTEQLQYSDYEVFGLDPYRPEPKESKATLLEGDLLDQGSLIRAIEYSEPDEIYNLGAESFVGRSWEVPERTSQVNAIGALKLLEAVRIVNPEIKVYQASTSEMFGNEPAPQNEQTSFAPRSPYGVAKQFAHSCMINYRESFGIPTYCGILFNHESPRRGQAFVTQKVCTAAAKKEPVVLGNLDAHRDWGYAGDYVRAMWMMMQGEPDDYVVATGEGHSVMDLCSIAYGHVGLNWMDYVSIDSRFMRPAEVHELLGDSSKIRGIGWEPEVSFTQLIGMMVDAHNQ